MERETMVMTLGDIMMDVDGADDDFSVESLLVGATANDLSFDATQADIGVMNMKDTAHGLSAARQNHTRSSYERSNTKSWGKKKLGAPKQTPSRSPPCPAILQDTRRRAMGLDPLTGELPKPKPEEMSATERIALAEAKKPSRKTVVTAVEDTNPRPKKLTQLEFDGKMDLHRKLYEKTPSGKWVINCAAARTYRHQVWEYNSKQRDEAGELIRTEHPDVKAVQLAA